MSLCFCFCDQSLKHHCTVVKSLTAGLAAWWKSEMGQHFHYTLAYRESTFPILPSLFQYLWSRYRFLLKAYHYNYCTAEVLPKVPSLQVTLADLFQYQRCQLPTFTHPGFCRETTSSIPLCYCLISHTKHKKFWGTLNSAFHQSSKVLATNTSSTSVNVTLPEPHP